MLEKRLLNTIKQDFKQVFYLPTKITNKIESTHHFRKTKTGKYHLVHNETKKAFCSFKIKTFGEEINILYIDEKDICIRCIQLYNAFRNKEVL
jgi:hypothetical protein